MNKKTILSLFVLTAFLTACAPKTQDLQGKFSSKSKVSGKLTISSPADQQVDQLLYAGQGEEDSPYFGKFNVKATGDDFKIDKLSLKIVDKMAVDSLFELFIKYPTDLSNPSTLDGLKSVNPTTAEVTFEDLAFMVPKDNDSVYFEIYGELNAHTDDSGTAESGDKIQLAMNKNLTFLAESQGTYSVHTGINVFAAGSIQTNTAYVFRTYPNITTSSDMTASLVYGSEAEVFKFSIINKPRASAALSDINLRSIGLDVSTSGLLTDSMGLGGTWSIVQNGVTHGTGTFDGAKVYLPISKDPSYSDQVAIDIAGGTAQTFSIYAPVVDDGVLNTNTISVRISEDTSPLYNKSVGSNYGELVTGDLANAALVWTDGDVSAADLKWHNGYKIDGLPTDYYILN